MNVSVGARIKAARKAAGLTQEQLAERIGISPKNLSFIETGRFGVGLETLIRICTVLHVSADTLLFGQANGEPAALCRDLAARLGSAPRAVGTAVGRNPLSILIPCHRVVGAGGALTGYAGGVERKRWLLEFERTPAKSSPLPDRQ